MKKPLNEIVNAQQAARLAALGVNDEKDIALTFLRQPERLAELLDIEVAEASRIIGMAAEHVPKEQIEELSNLADRIEQIPHGALPPDGREGQR